MSKQYMKVLHKKKLGVYGNPNVTKLSKFKLKGVKVQSLHMEGCKRSMLQTEGAKLKYSVAYGRVQKVKLANSRVQKLCINECILLNSGMDWWNTAILKFCRILDFCTFAPLSLQF